MSKEKVVAWKQQNITGLPGFLDEYCSCIIEPGEHESVDYVLGNETELAGLY